MSRVIATLSQTSRPVIYFDQPPPVEELEAALLEPEADDVGLSGIHEELPSAVVGTLFAQTHFPETHEPF